MIDLLKWNLKEKWISALRSGNFKQGRCSLYSEDNNSYCCLGVLGVIRGIHLESMDEKSDMGNTIYKDVIPSWLESDNVRHLVRMNDYQKCNFNEIADFIETI